MAWICLLIVCFVAWNYRRKWKNLCWEQKEWEEWNAREWKRVQKNHNADDTFKNNLLRDRNLRIAELEEKCHVLLAELETEKARQSSKDSLSKEQHDQAIKARNSVIANLEADLKRVNEDRARMAEEKLKFIDKIDRIKAVVE